VNITNNTIPSTLSNTFRIASFAHDCIPPPPWMAITSPADPHFTSLRIVDPPAGYTTSIGIRKSGSIVLGWEYIDQRNSLDKGINNLTVEFVNFETGQATGLYRWKSSDLLSASFPFAGTDVSVGAWQLRANYSNALEGSPPGATITHLSEKFFITGEQGGCSGIGRRAKANGAEQSKRLSMPCHITLLTLAAVSIYR
jgi:hypothetical protein